VERVIEVLNLLAAHPGQRYTLSDISRDLGFNKATLHALLWALTEAGYLVRDNADKSYTVGPALIALGNAAMEGFAVVQAALPEMELLQAELGHDCIASAAIHNEIVILARTGRPRPFGVNVLPGMRVPLVPPLGTVFVAWSGQAEIERYLARVGPSNELDKYRRAVDVVRTRGYSVARASDGHEAAISGLPLAESVRGLPQAEYSVLDIDAESAYRLRHIAAPVFGAWGEVVIALFLIGFQNEVPAREVPEIAARLKLACSRISDAITGNFAADNRLPSTGADRPSDKTSEKTSEKPAGKTPQKAGGNTAGKTAGKTVGTRRVTGDALAADAG
jgi:DNA-binding IclR family transcriptional regulator